MLASGNPIGGPAPSSPGVVVPSSPASGPPSVALFDDVDDEHAVATATAHESAQSMFAFLIGRTSASDQVRPRPTRTLPDEIRGEQSPMRRKTARWPPMPKRLSMMNNGLGETF
jgi:hypothetical protein